MKQSVNYITSKLAKYTLSSKNNSGILGYCGARQFVDPWYSFASIPSSTTTKTRF